LLCAEADRAGISDDSEVVGVFAGSQSVTIRFEGEVVKDFSGFGVKAL